MEELDVDGLFWLANKPDDKVAGRLTFDSANGAELNLIGSFHELPSSRSYDLQEVLSPLHEPARILGVAGKRRLTLEHCMHSGISAEMPGMVRERYLPEVILSGAHFEANQPLEFSTIHIELRHLDHWIGKSGTQTKFRQDESGSGISKIDVSYSPPPKSVIPTEIGDLELQFTYSVRGDSVTETTIAQKCSIGVKFVKPHQLEDVIKIGSAIQDLLTVGVHSASPFKKVTLKHPALVHTLANGSEEPEQVEVYSELRGSNVQQQEKRIHPARMLFTFDDIGGLDGVAKWLRTYAKFSQVINSLLGHWYMPSMYTDNYLLNTIIATETLERIRLQKQRINFGKSLRSLVDLAGAPFEVMVHDKDAWVKEVVQARVNYMVHRGLRGNLEGERMYILSESLYFLVILCLLRECGISEETLTKVQNHQRFKWVATNL